MTIVDSRFPIPPESLTDEALNRLIRDRFGLDGDVLSYTEDVSLMLSQEMRETLTGLGVYELQMGWETIGYFATVYGRAGQSGKIVGSSSGKQSPGRAVGEAVAQAIRRLKEGAKDASSKK